MEYSLMIALFFITYLPIVVLLLFMPFFNKKDGKLWRIDSRGTIRKPYDFEHAEKLYESYSSCWSGRDDSIYHRFSNRSRRGGLSSRARTRFKHIYFIILFRLFTFSQENEGAEGEGAMASGKAATSFSRSKVS